MWWGKGDTSKLDEEQKTTLSHLRRLDETGHLRTLSAAQSEIAFRAVEFFGRWESVFLAFTSLRNVFILVGALLAMWWAFETQITDWIRGIAGP